MVRGLSFTPEDDAALAKAWVSVSSQQNEQNAPQFWSNVRDFFNHKQDCDNIDRTGDSLRSRWHVLQRSVQKYLAAEAAYLSKPVSGETSEDSGHNIMKLYCARTKRKDAYGNVRPGPPMKSMAAVEILRNIPKFKDAK